MSDGAIPSAAASRATCTQCGRTYDATPPATHREEILGYSLDIAVMVAIDELRRTAWRDVTAVAHASANVVAAHADDLQFGGKQCRATFAALARGLGALAFPPGGVAFLGRHWCATHPEAAAR